MVTSESRQKLMKTLGEYGCYFLSVVHLAEELTNKRIDAIQSCLAAMDNKWLDDEITMLNPEAVLHSLTGKRFVVRKEEPAYSPKEGEYEVLLFRNGSFDHFVLGDGKGKVAYDPLGNSNSVASGKLTSKRIFKRI
ncbi:MAG: DUF261 domain-containing protein [Treponema sp.]|jgi:hypothetical protein|nr:DUF261 domain-containing protein [Treponema sp.]